MIFKEIYPPRFIQQFNDAAPAFEKLKTLDGTPYIPLDEVARVLDITIQYKQLADDNNGEFEHDTRTLSINEKDPKTRKRFTIAHEIGHAVLNHPGISLRSTSLTAYDSIVKKSNEMAANGFAADLLMPRALMVSLTQNIITSQRLNADSLGADDVQNISIQLADELGVSRESMSYRIKNVRLFVNHD
ncbi:hypothetical protein [Lactobacillus plantarum] [Lactiplantibacillus mudanjiangensis]|uniref:ImmA/IrrE family metallo-endopeptidase n=1 Tax=Lactiplantibacillus mudanjiangensis TaxID=1296538 RepID=UPI0010146323|nr:hypothetical protein [Lactobacillus plantarum] [Lactiplantibacillus mudanjiangensis]